MDALCWVLLFTSAFFTTVDWYLYLLSFYLIGRIIYRRSRVKRDLKNAVDYVRVHKGWLRNIVTNIFVISCGVSLSYLDKFIPKPKGDLFVFGFLVLLLLYMINYRYQNFSNGLRWYVSGIKLPGDRSLLIPWRHVSEVKEDGKYIHLTVFDKKYKLAIELEDHRSAKHFARWYEKKSAVNSGS